VKSSLIVILAGGGLLAAVLIGSPHRNLLIAIAIVIIVVAVLLRYAGWRVILGGRMIIGGPDGKGAGKCSRCGADVVFQLPIKPGEKAFTCDACGETGTWK